MYSWDHEHKGCQVRFLNIHTKCNQILNKLRDFRYLLSLSLSLSLLLLFEHSLDCGLGSMHAGYGKVLGYYYRAVELIQQCQKVRVLEHLIAAYCGTQYD